ncbi:hypothetical protein [Streptomyces sp. NPDC048248]|uniref:hypothetical protein n=1 Tax=Streptomyces sp. NPDC048248 TaxID=3365523 RepID=UPI00371276BB
MNKIITVVGVLAASALGLAGQAQTGPAPMPSYKGQPLMTVYRTVDAGTRVDVRDVSGLKRHVLWPANWKTCTQVPAPGAPVSSPIKIGVVKKAERCP